MPLSWRVPFETMEKNTNATGVVSKSLHDGDCLGQLNRSDDHTSEIKILQINPDTVDSGVLRKCVCGFFHSGRADGNCKECKSHGDWQTNPEVIKVIIDVLTEPKAPSGYKEQMLSDPNPLSIDIKNSSGVDSANPTVVHVQSHQEKILAVY